MPTPPQDRPPEISPDTAMDDVYTPADPLGSDDLPLGQVPDSEQAGGLAADEATPALDADVVSGDVPEDDFPASGAPPGDPGPF